MTGSPKAPSPDASAHKVNVDDARAFRLRKAFFHRKMFRRKPSFHIRRACRTCASGLPPLGNDRLKSDIQGRAALRASWACCPTREKALVAPQVRARRFT
jgi:hypothetical protein